MKKLSELDESKIKWVQQRLKLAGWDLKLDGVCGDKTIKAFKEFKELHYLGLPEMFGDTTEQYLKAVESTHKGTNEANGDPFYTNQSRLSQKRYPEWVIFPFGQRVNLYENISPNFQWWEFTKGKSRLPTHKQHAQNIIKIAKALEPLRAKFGTLRINSGYRPTHINRQVGGSSHSRHLVGDAVDVCRGSKQKNKELQDYCLRNWGNKGGVGRGVKMNRRANGFVHLDLRGYPARWDY